MAVALPMPLVDPVIRAVEPVKIGGHDYLSISGAATPKSARMILECQLQKSVGCAHA